MFDNIKYAGSYWVCYWEEVTFGTFVAYAGCGTNAYTWLDGEE